MSDESTTRVFFAINLDDSIKHQIHTEIEALKKICNMPIRWVRESQLHLTLRFIADITQNQLADIYHQVHFLEETASFDLKLDKIAIFPSQKPRIIGIKIDLSDELAQLVATLNHQLRGIGLESDERSFLPHITLGRIAKPKRKPIALDGLTLPPRQRVNKIILFRSELTPDGSIYSVLKEFKLKPLPVLV